MAPALLTQSGISVASDVLCRVGGSHDPTCSVPGASRGLFPAHGTLCTRSCRHCFNVSGPRDPWLAPLDSSMVRRYLSEADALGAREIYFTGGEPFRARWA